jgi:alkylation response protein AidB-like acyl-CoA dehydrogenase
MLADIAMSGGGQANGVHRRRAGRARRAGAGLHGSASKCFASDVAMKVTTDAVQLSGGYGYTTDFPVERFMRDTKITQI